MLLSSRALPSMCEALGSSTRTARETGKAKGGACADHSP